MSSNKDFKKRRREEEMDDREQKRRRSDQEDRRSRSYHNSRSADQNRHNNNYNNRNRRAHNYSNNGNPSNNETNRNNNSAHSTKYNQPQYRIKENSDNNRILEKKPKKKIAIHLLGDSTELKANNNNSLHFNLEHNNINNQKQIPPSVQKPKVSNSSAPLAADPAPPLPGYYYDPDVNRYFKLPPSGTVMYKKYQEVLKKIAEKEQKQQEETKQREEKERIDRGVNISILSSKYKSPLSTIMRRETGSSQRPKEFMAKSLGSLFKRIERRYRFPWPLGDTECYDMISVANGERLVTGLRDGQMMIDELEWKDNDIHVNGLCTTESSSISSVGYSSIFEPIYSATILGGGRSGELKLYTSQLHAKHSTKLRKGSMWCHEWSPNGQYISMGISKGAMILDNATMRTLNCFTEKSDVFAQAFTESSKILLNGSRDGKIRTFDIRQSMQRTPFGSHASIMKHESSITCLKLLKDDNYMVANSINGVINVWDRRVCKVVTRMEYPNQMTSTKFSVDPNEEFVLIGGDDRKVYIWNLKSGEITHTLGPYAIPIKSLVFGRSWIQDRVRVPGFWTFLNNSIELYGICDVKM